MSQTLTNNDSHAPALTRLREEVAQVGTEVASAFRRLLEALPARPARPSHLAAHLGLNTNLTHKLATAVAKEDPLEALLVLPGPAPLAQVADEAERKGASAAACEAAREAARRFDALVRRVAGDRTSFDALVSDWVPSSRAQIDAAARQSVHRGMRQLLGVSAELQFNLYMFAPSPSDPDLVDVATVDGQMGLRRVRAGGGLRLSAMSTLERRCATADTTRAVLTDFCSTPTPSFRIAGPKERATYELEWHDTVGPASSRDVVLGEVHRRSFTRYCSRPEAPLATVACALNAPSRAYAGEVLIHHDLYNGTVPEFRALSTGLKGHANPNAPAGHEPVATGSEVRAIPAGRVLVTPLAGLAFYGRLVRAQAGALNCDAEQFRSFRVEFDYPVFDSQMQFVLRLPERPR